MEKAEAESSKKSSGFCSRKVIRRKSHTRKAPTSCLTNMAEARREIVNALHLHRSASSLLHSNKHHFNNNPPILDTTTCNCNSNSINDQKYYYHQLLESSMPIPEPTWSTTAPAVLCAPVPTVDVLDEFDWLDNLSSSYSWWIGFLNFLDGKINVNGHLASESKEGLGQCLDEEKLDLDVGNEQSSVADEWLIFLATEECGEKLECELST